MTYYSQRLLDALIKHWLFCENREEYYLIELLPSLMADPAKGDELELEILGELRSRLVPDEWRDLPYLLAVRRDVLLKNFKTQRDQREAGVIEKHKAEQLAALKERERVLLHAALKRAAAQRRDDEQRKRLRQEESRRLFQVKRNELLQEIRGHLCTDFLGTDSFFNAKSVGLVSQQDYEQAKLAFVKSWLGMNTPSAKNGEKCLPDEEQVAAVAAVHGHVQVVARAGSGKTTTLVNRTLFLLKHCGVAPGEMLLLAFNRKAALEIRRRLLALLDQNADAAVVADIDRRTRTADKRKRTVIDEVEASAVDAIAAKLNITLPHVMTFHALAYAIVHPEESLLYNGAEGESQGLSRAFQQVINDHLQLPVFKAQIRELMLAHFREDWDRIVEGCYDQDKQELLRIRRSLPRESLGGDDVKSYGEKVIANFLFEHDIAYKYERNHWWQETKDGVPLRTNYRPDFTIFKAAERGKESGVIIEYFGLKGDDDYDDMSNNKRAYWNAKKSWTLIDFCPADMASDGVDSFLKLLKQRLESQGISCVRLSEDEIWHRLSDRAIDRFTVAAVGFIGKCRKQSYSPSALQSEIDKHSAISPVEGMFLKLAHSLYVGYLDRRSATGDEDFDGLMQRAAEAIDAGQTLFQRKSGSGDLAALRYACIDEFQDFSDLFYRLLNAIRSQNSKIELFCVGDDWQAINGFAGSDLRFFKNFEEHIGVSSQLYISTNYRSSNAIVTVGNALMEGLGRPAVANKKSIGRVLVSDINDFEPSLLERQRHPGDNITPAVLRLVSKALADGLDIVLLNRTNHLNWYVAKSEAKKLDGFLESIRSYFPKDQKDRIHISTAHKYKGLEKRMVIVLDAVARRYPLIHPDWIFSRIFGETPEKISKEERRLLYVALTRAVEALVIITDGRSKSPFLVELESMQPLNAIKWLEYPVARPLTDQRMVIRIGKLASMGGRGGTYVIKDFLDASGFSWHSVDEVWEKSLAVDGFRLEMLKSEVWANQAHGVDVQIFDDCNKLMARYLIDEGKWNCILDKLVTGKV